MEYPQVPSGAEPRSTVLIADDNRDAADSLAMLLEMNGHEVMVVHGGLEALKAAQQAKPRAVILDIGMPDLTGHEVALKIRAESWGRDVLLVALTGWGHDEDKARAAAAGFNHHLTKPVDPDEVETLLREFLDRERQDGIS